MKRSFDNALDFGDRCQRLVEAYLHSINYLTIPSYDFTGSDGDNAPKLKGSCSSYVLPDLDCCRDGERRWVEVKGKEQAVFNRTFQALVHGIEKRHYDDYLAIERLTNTTVWLMILEIDTGHLLTRELSRLSTYPCLCRGCRSGMRCRAQREPLIYFLRDDFTRIHTFERSDLDALRTANFPLEGSQEPLRGPRGV